MNEAPGKRTGSSLPNLWRRLAPGLVTGAADDDNAQAVEILLTGRVSTEEFDGVAAKLEAFIDRHGHVRVLEIIQDFEGMDAVAFWHDIKFSLRHLKDFSRMAVVCNPDTHHLWSRLAHLAESGAFEPLSGMA